MAKGCRQRLSVILLSLTTKKLLLMLNELPSGRFLTHSYN